jgi:cyclin C
VNLAWSVINDHYMTDLPLMYAPHLIAVTAILLALVLRPGTNGPQAMASSAAGMASGVTAALGAISQQKAGQNGEKGRASRTKLQQLADFLAESDLDVEAIVNCVQEMISFYEVQEAYNEKLTKESINRFVKALGLDK